MPLKLFFYVTLVCILLSNSIMALNTPKVLLRTNILGPVSLQTEFRVKPKQGLNLGYQIWPSAITIFGEGNVNLFSGDYRLYASSFDETISKQRSFYVAPYLRYYFWNNEYERHSSQSWFGSSYRYTSEKSLLGGLIFGYQWNYKSHFSLDLYGGGGYSLFANNYTEDWDGNSKNERFRQPDFRLGLAVGFWL